MLLEEALLLLRLLEEDFVRAFFGTGSGAGAAGAFANALGNLGNLLSLAVSSAVVGSAASSIFSEGAVC